MGRRTVKVFREPLSSLFIREDRPYANMALVMGKT